MEEILRRLVVAMDALNDAHVALKKANIPGLELAVGDTDRLCRSVSQLISDINYTIEHKENKENKENDNGTGN